MRRGRLAATPQKTLTDQQKYLLQRLPSLYELKARKTAPEPANIRNMRRHIERYDARQAKLATKAKCAAEKALIAAREAIYFKPVKQALLAVKRVEGFKSCCGGDC